MHGWLVATYILGVRRYGIYVDTFACILNTGHEFIRSASSSRYSRYPEYIYVKNMYWEIIDIGAPIDLL